MQVGDLGSMALMMDPVGTAVGSWHAGTHIGFGKYNEPGAAARDQVQSKDFAATLAFYQEGFGWGISKMSDTDEF